MTNTTMLSRFDEVSSYLADMVNEITNLYQQLTNVQDNHLMVQIPESNIIDMDLNDILSLVARTSNVYGTLARFSGIAKANQKMAEGKFKKVYKNNRHGKNEAEREANAMTAADEAFSEFVMAEAISSMLDSLENGARVASESARKILDKWQSMQIASHRGSHGAFQDKDFSY